MAGTASASDRGSYKVIADMDTVDEAVMTTNEKDETVDGSDEFIDPRLKNYPIPLVAKTVGLGNNFDEPILTFRFFVLATFWVICGDAISTIYFFKPYSSQLSSYIVQLLSWSMGNLMARSLPARQVSVFGTSFSLNPGPWGAKEHALVVVAYWGSCRTAFGLGPLSALELYYGRKISSVYGLLFLLTSQMIGYGFAGLYRDVLVRPPKLFYPGVLPNVALFNALHRNPSAANNALKFFAYVSCATFCWQWFPGVIFPMLSSLPLLCYMVPGNRISYILGSGYSGFGFLDISLDWNYAGFFQPLYTPLWASLSQIVGAMAVCWVIYPCMYFANVLDSLKFPPMSSGIFDSTGSDYNISRVINNGGFTLNQTAVNDYSEPHWSISYLMYFFWGFASTTGVLVYALLWYGKDGYTALVGAWNGRRNDYNDDVYLKLMRNTERVPHWWYLVLLVVCLCLSLACLYGADLGLPWWGFVVICVVSAIFIFPSGILFGLANMQVDLGFLSELLAGAMFHGNPSAVLVSMTYGRTVLEQSLNLISDYKFGFYMKIPEKEMFWAQLYGTLLGPFANYGVMRLIIDGLGEAVLMGARESNAWHALRTKNYYSISVLWGILGPQVIFGNRSEYNWIYWAFFVGAALVIVAYIVDRFKPEWQVETRCNPVVIMYGATYFPVFQTTNLFTSAMVAVFFMGYVFRYHPAWFRKYNYLLGAGLDCGTQVTETVIMFALNLTNSRFPNWWGNDALFPDRCFPPP